LRGWQRGADGAWRALVELPVPAIVVARIPGEDYAHVPRSTGGQDVAYLLTAARLADVCVVTLHRADCWAVFTRGATPVVTTRVARFLVNAEQVTPCDACEPTKEWLPAAPSNHRRQRVQQHRHRRPHRGPHVQHARPRATGRLLRAESAQAW